jgi:hypothetical protein
VRLACCVVALLACCGFSHSLHGHPGHGGGSDPASSEAPADIPTPDFSFDKAKMSVNARVFDGTENYDADVALHGGETWCTWLEFVPKQGDGIWIGVRDADGWRQRFLATPEHGDFAAPTLTRDGDDLWLTYEAAVDAKGRSQWDVFAQRVGDKRLLGEPIKVSDGRGADVRHAACALPRGGIYVVWQSDRNGQFDVVGRRISNNTTGDVEVIGDFAAGDWHPRVAAGNDGRLHVVWDAFDGDDFDVYLRTRSDDGPWGDIHAVADSPAFEARADVAVDDQGRTWISWEEGGENWGRPFRGINTTLLRDHSGPVHRYRLLRLAVLTPDGKLGRLADTLPLPSLETAQDREEARPDSRRLGVFYERARLAIDGRGRPWIAYRHYYTPWLGVEHRSHVEEGWGVYARCYTNDGWSPLLRFDVGQGDGLQRLELAATDRGIAAVWTTGRTHRTRNKRPRGVVYATAVVAGVPAAVVKTDPTPSPSPVENRGRPKPERGEPVEIGGKQYQLFFGDLHRHTDLSLCRVPIDGTLDDAYRYANEVAGLDFLGITDHSRDIAMGNPLSQLWWRSRKEVLRYQTGDRFLPFYAYERSHSNTADHNVISLRDDMLRPHTYPVPEFWKELDADTMTIPHQPIRRDTWNYQNELLRPLVEIFQGCRDNSIEDDVHRGLAKGYHLGFIASSDHMSTSSSYACVWAEEATRESIFRAMQARRTFGATTTIRLKLTAGDRWMGERVNADELEPLLLEVQGTAPIRSVRMIVDGKEAEVESPMRRSIRLSRTLDLPPGDHYVYFHIQQADGNEAWSSPVWVERE